MSNSLIWLFGNQGKIPTLTHNFSTLQAIIAYRAETAIAALLSSATVDFPMARQLLQSLFVTEADILPDKAKKQLRIRVHSTSRPASNRVMEMLFEQLNRTELNYPGTDMCLIYELTSSTKN